MKRSTVLSTINRPNRRPAFGAIFQRAMGAKGDVPGRRRQVADIVLSWLKPESVCQSRS